VTKIKSLADLQPGDIMFGPIGGAVGLGVGLGQVALGEGFRVGTLSVRHVGIVVEAGTVADPTWESGALPRLVQAMPGGAEEIGMMMDTHWTPRHAYVRLPEDYPGQAADAAAIARLMVAQGVSYSFASYAALAAWKWGLKAERLERWIGRRGPRMSITLPASPTPFISDGVALPLEAICSVLVDQAWSLTGKKIMEGVPHQCVTPGALAGRLLFETEGVTWGLPR
jgi:hypothetical protein